MVRTLDHGETLRLQYRSLERLPNNPDQRPVGGPQNPVDAPRNPRTEDTHTQATHSNPAPGASGKDAGANKAVSIAARSQQVVMMALNRRNTEPTKTPRGIPASQGPPIGTPTASPSVHQGQVGEPYITQGIGTGTRPPETRQNINNAPDPVGAEDAKDGRTL
jgi:hypothetical protein